MRQEFRKQLTKLRKIQDKVLRQQSKYQHSSMYLTAYDMGSNACMDVSCYRDPIDGGERENIRYSFWERPHYDEIPYQRMLDEINEFFGFKADDNEPLTEE